MTESKSRSTAKRTSQVSKPSKTGIKPKSVPKANTKAKPAKTIAGGNSKTAKTDGKQAALTDSKKEQQAASQLIDQRIRELDGWRGETLARMRKLILEADPEIIEEWKWSVPVWSHNGIVCTGESYKKVVKLTFARGASLPDPSHLFNSSLDGNARRAIDIQEGEKIDAAGFKALVRAAVAHNGSPTKKSRPVAKGTKPIKANKTEKAGVVLLSGGNPQIAKADGDAPVQAYIAAMPGWKYDLGKRLDTLIVQTVPDVRKAVKWNSPFYGIEGQGWFLSFHVFARYVKVAFFRGVSLRPIPPGASKNEDTRYLDIYEIDFDETLFATWVKQAAALPGWLP